MKKAMFLERKCAPEDFLYTLRFTDSKMYKVYGEEKHDGKYYLLVKNDSGTKELVPKDCFVVENGYCNIAEVENLKKLRLGELNIRILNPRRSGIETSRRTIDVVLIDQIAERLCRIMDSKGSKYFVILKRKSYFRTNCQCYVAVSYENVFPSVGEKHQFSRIASYPSSYSHRSNRLQECLILNVTKVKKIGYRWLEVGGFKNGNFIVVYTRLPFNTTP